MAVAVHQQAFPAPLPEIRTVLRGRTDDAGTLRAMVLDPAIPLVTITGPGGVGKTSLALHVAHDVAGAFGGDVAFVPLAAIRQAPLALLAIGQVFGMFSDPHDGYEDSLIALLRNRRALVVLDNLEQVPDVAPSIDRLVEECPGLVILATSQVALDLGHEQVFPLAPLPTIDPADASGTDLAASDAVALFVDRAREIAPGFVADESETVAIARLCARLDGLPLAIELAAARANMLSPHTMLERIDTLLETLGKHRGDVPDRLRTMRAAIAWSHDLLQAGEQALLRRLAVFEGGIALGGAAFVAGRDVGSALEVLADRNLLLREMMPDGERGYRMLEVIRRYNLDVLRERGEEAAARHAHADYVASFADEAADQLVGPDQVAWYARVDAAMPDIRAAIAWALANGHAGIVLRIGGRLAPYFTYRALNAEALGWLRQALADPALSLSPYRARALEGAGRLASYAHDHETAEEFFAQARHLAQATGDRHVERATWTGLGTSAQWRGNFDLAMDAYTEAARIARELDDPHAIAVTTGNLGLAHLRLGHFREALDIWTDARGLFADCGDIGALGNVIMNMGTAAKSLGLYDEAEGYFRDALAIQETTGNLWSLSLTLMVLGELYLSREDYARGAEFFERARDTIHELYGASSGQAGEATLGLAWSRFHGGDVESGVTLLLEVLQMKEDAPGPVWLVGSMTLLADILIAHDRVGDALMVLAAEVRVREETGMGLTESRREEIERVQALARDMLDAAAYDASWAKGQAIPDDSLNREMQRMVRQVIGRQHAGPSVPETDGDPFGLTSREIDVLSLIATGKTTREIAAALEISPRTVATHTANILVKMDVGSRTAAMALAARKGLISLDDAR